MHRSWRAGLPLAGTVVLALLTTLCVAPQSGATVAQPAQVTAAMTAVSPDACGPQIRKRNGKAWVCTFADDFSGSSLDPANWNVMTSENAGGHPQECRVDNPNNVSVANGTLRLTARRKLAPFTCNAFNGAFLTTATGGAVTSSRNFAQRYGRVEIRARMPRYRGVGFHSAQWMYPQDPAYGAWPASGEIDINEYRTGLFGRAVPTLHWLRNGEHRSRTDWDCRVRRPHAFHSYVLVWTARKIKFKYDGNLCLVKRLGDTAASRKPFDQPFFLILNQSVGGGLNAPTLLTPSAARMTVDYVRAWR